MMNIKTKIKIKIKFKIKIKMRITHPQNRSYRSNSHQNPRGFQDRFTSQDTNQDRFAPPGMGTDPDNPQASGLRLLESRINLGQLRLDHFQPNSGPRSTKRLKVSSNDISRTFQRAQSTEYKQTVKPARPSWPAMPAQLNQPTQVDQHGPAEIGMKTSKTRFKRKLTRPNYGLFRKKKPTKPQNNLVISVHIIHRSVTRRPHYYESLLPESGTNTPRVPYYQQNYLVKTHQGAFLAHDGYQKPKNNNKNKSGTSEEKAYPKFGPNLKNSHSPRIFKGQFKKTREITPRTSFGPQQQPEDVKFRNSSPNKEV